MADTFTFVKDGKKKVYNIAGGTEEEAMKYVRYLHRNALFGTHTGLPPQIKNSKMNESLVSNIGDYSVLDVYAKQLTKCMIGTVVNFILDNTVNPLGETYVYPCTDKNKPMGYMISDATPDTMGVCLVHGVLEVPLYYFGAEGEKKNYVEYDLENKCFKFSDSGYPVFNVYQDVDGDWIAIILFGDVSSDYEYDGPFAVSVAGVTGSTMFVDIASGDFIHENDRNHFDDEDLMSNIALGSGETLWLNTYLSGATWSYSFEARNASPTQSPGGSLWYRIAENTGNDLVQLQYGDIFNDIQHLQVESVSGSTAFIRISGYSSSNRSEDNIMLRGVGCSFNTLGLNDIGIIVEGSTGGSLVQHLYSSLKTIDGTTVSSPAICITDSSDYVNIVGGTNTYVELGEYGEIIVGSTVSGGTGSSFNYTGSFKVDCWDTEDEGVVHNVRIYDSNNRDDMAGDAGWVHIGNQKYRVPEYSNTFSDGDVIYLIGTFNESNELSSFEFRKIQTFFPNINDNQFCVRICYATNGKMYQTQYGDIVQPARLVGDGETVEIHSNVISAIGGGGGGTVQGLYSAIKGGTPAICITGSTTYVLITGGTNTYTERDSSGAIVVGCTASGGGVGYVVNHYYHTQYSYLTNSGGTGILQAIANCSYDILLKSNSDTFTVEQLKVRYSSTAPSSQVDSIDDKGCLLIELPTGVTEECYIDFHFAYPVATVFASPDGKNIIDVYGANTNMTQPYADNNTVRMIYVTTDSDYTDGCWYFTII